MSATEEDAQLDALTDTLTSLVVDANQALRQLWAIRHERESHRMLVHDGSAVPDDMPHTTACDDEPPEVR